MGYCRPWIVDRIGNRVVFFSQYVDAHPQAELISSISVIITIIILSSPFVGFGFYIDHLKLQMLKNGSIAPNELETTDETVNSEKIEFVPLCLAFFISSGSFF